MRKLPTLLAALFILITLQRVAHFSANTMQAGALGWLFAIGLGGAVFASAYWTRVSALNRTGEEDYRSRNTRHIAWVALIAFMAADGYFNLIEVLQHIHTTQPSIMVAAYVYGIFPTAAAAGLGAMQGFVDRLPAASHKRRVTVGIALQAWAIKALGGNELPALPVEQEYQSPAYLPPAAGRQLPNKASAGTTLYYCDYGCGYSHTSIKGKAGHMKACRLRPAQDQKE